MLARFRERWVLTVVSAAACVALPKIAPAQTADYFATPWFFNPATGAAGAQTPGSANSQAPAPRSNLYAQSVAAATTYAPPLLYSFNMGIDEVATDNVAETESHRQADLGSLFSVGTSLAANTERLTASLAATGFYRQNINDTQLNQFSEFAYGSGQGTVIPDHLFLNASAVVDDLTTDGGGLQNAFAQANRTTHSYVVSGSPYLASRFGDFAINVIRYQIGQAWFSNNGPTNPFSGQNGSLTAASEQTAREDFKMAGTVFPRLMSDVSLSGDEQDSGNTAAGTLQSANGELINEYEVTRSASLIAAGGYEFLHDQEVPSINGQGAIWDFGGRLKPNPDSSLLLVYGRHDEKADFGGEFAWRITPFTDIYAGYTDSFTTSQQTVISNDATSVLGPDGAVSGISFDRSTLIGVLDDAALSAGPATSLAPLGVPLAGINNYSPLENGLFRTKIFSAAGRSVVDGDPITLSAYYAQQISLTPLFVPSNTTQGIQLSWSPQLSERLAAFALAGYAHLNGEGRSDMYSAALGATYRLSDTLALSARYDFLLRAGDANSGGYLQDSVTLSIHKFFEP